VNIYTNVKKGLGIGWIPSINYLSRKWTLDLRSLYRTELIMAAVKELLTCK
jgi:hypothetical protein